MMSFKWATASAQDRGDFVRQHLQTLHEGAVRRLFRLTEKGITRIEGGDAWRPEYDEEYATDNPIHAHIIPEWRR